ncbi:MAG: TIGR04255 family protein [Dehalococcoidia bacterium]
MTTVAFPVAERVIYERNPLAEVICQLRFSPILEIEVQPPAEFQRRIRLDYPEYAVNQRAEFPVADLPPDLARALNAVAQGIIDHKTAHNFVSSDGFWTVALTKDFVALSTKKYYRWEEFRRRLDLIIDALGVYEVPYFTRIGLRYRDAINRTSLGIPNTSWGELLQPYIAGELVASELADSAIVEMRRLSRMKLDNQLQVALQHGLARHDEKDDSGESIFLFDADLFTEERIDASDRTKVLELLDSANAHARNLFRWAITDRLHSALGPRAVDP